MRKFNRLTIDSSRCDLMTVVKYQIDNFDLTKLWGQGKVKENLDDKVKLFVDKYLDKPDLMGNPISWFICSNRLVDIWKPKILNDVQLIKVPIYNIGTKEKVFDYQILNPIRFIEALNLKKSNIIKTNNKISTVTKFVFNIDKIPPDIHIFRPIELPNAIIVSEELFEALVGKGIEGVAFLSCESAR